MRFYTGWVIRDRVEPAAGPAMSASHPKRPSAMKMRSVAKGHNQTHAVQQTAIYSITSSAVASSAVGIVRASILAVLRLITKSNLVGCKTGNSAGLAPPKILPL